MVWQTLHWTNSNRRERKRKCLCVQEENAPHKHVSRDYHLYDLLLDCLLGFLTKWSLFSFSVVTCNIYNCAFVDFYASLPVFCCCYCCNIVATGFTRFVSGHTGAIELESFIPRNASKRCLTIMLLCKKKRMKHIHTANLQNSEEDVAIVPKLFINRAIRLDEGNLCSPIPLSDIDLCIGLWLPMSALPDPGQELKKKTSWVYNLHKHGV